MRPNEENIIFIFWDSWFGWVGLWGGRYLFFRYVCPFLHSQTRDGLREKTEPIRKYHLYFLEFLVGLGWVGLALWGGHVYSFGTFVFLHSQTGDGLRKIADPMRKTSSLFFGSRGLVGLGWVGLAS